jgi:hypothetical protein
VSASLEARYRRLLRWYPRQWRDRNADAIVGILLDQAESKARITPTATEGASLMLGGLRERFARAQHPSALTIVAHACALAFSVWYLAVIAWAPDITYPGTVGSFTNPAVVTAALLAIALALAVARQPLLARVFSAAAALTAMVIFVLAVALGWLGPGPVPTALFVGLGIAGTLQQRARREVVVVPVAVALAALSVLGLHVAAQNHPVIFVAQFWLWALLGVAAGAAAILLVAWTYVNRSLAYAARQ